MFYQWYSKFFLETKVPGFSIFPCIEVRKKKNRKKSNELRRKFSPLADGITQKFTLL